jgi:hypothetical protein
MEHLMEVFQLLVNMPHNFQTLPVMLDNLSTSFPWSFDSLCSNLDAAGADCEKVHQSLISWTLIKLSSISRSTFHHF